MSCPFCKNGSIVPSSNMYYSWKTADGRVIKLGILACTNCHTYFFTNPETGAFVVPSKYDDNYYRP